MTFTRLVPEHMLWLLSHPLEEGITYPLGDGRVAEYDAQTGDIVVKRDGRDVGRIPTKIEEGLDDDV